MIFSLIRLLFVVSAIAKNDEINNNNNNRQLPALKAGKNSFVSQVTRSFPARVNGQSYSSRVTLALSQNERVVLNLEPDLDLLSTDYEEVEITPSGQRNVLKKLKDMNMCWFKGSIEGDPNSRVAVTDCDGSFGGLIKKGNGRHFIAKSVGDVGEVAVYASEDEEPLVGTCGAVPPPGASRRLLHVHNLPVAFSGFSEGPNSHLFHNHEIKNGDHAHSDIENNGDDDEVRLKQSFGDSSSSSSVASSSAAAKRNLLVYSPSTDVMEIATASDFLYLNANGGASAVAQLNIQILSIIRTMYENATFARATSLRLKAQYFFTAGDPYFVPQDAQGRANALTLLETFTTWTKNQLSSLPFDDIHLLTSHTFDSDTVGLAYVGAACNPSYKTGLSTASFGVTNTANIMGHELGHNLGMDHDGASESGAECVSSGYLMGPYMNTCPLTGICPISSCSRTAKDAYTSTVTCLQTWTEPTCADGLLNGDESGVDCGGSLCGPCTVAPTRPTTRMPTMRPTRQPTGAPTARPTRLPTLRPTSRPSRSPTARPTRIPTREPTARPTRTPTIQPTTRPSRSPTARPTRKPTREPTTRPTRVPTTQPTTRPTRVPTTKPTTRPSRSPTARPTRKPTSEPTARPTR